MISRIIGGILLIVGTSIGAGMLALPIAHANLGLTYSLSTLIITWALMTSGAFYILEANLYLPPGKNMISMANATIGKWGSVITWISYLLLLYTLLAAYISGGADVAGYFLSRYNLHFSDTHNAMVFTLLFGFIVSRGIASVDWTNRVLMFSKLAIYVLLIVFIAPHIEFNNLKAQHQLPSIDIVMIMITSFGFAIIVPSLRDYFDDNIKLLKLVILIGSLIPLICYFAWNFVIIGSLPSQGEHALSTLMTANHATTALATLIQQTIHISIISKLFDAFSSICMLTAFLGVSLCLMSFIADGLGLECKGKNTILISGLTFLPPLVIVIIAPSIYIKALSVAGILCVVLLLIMPILMSFFGRPRYSATYVVKGGKPLQIFLLFASCVLFTLATYRLFIT